MPPLLWIKPVMLMPLRKGIRKILEQGWKEELKKMDWPSEQSKAQLLDENNDQEQVFDFWEDLIIELANEYEKGEMTPEEVLSFLTPEPGAMHFPTLKSDNQELQTIIKHIETFQEKQKATLAEMAQKVMSAIENSSENKKQSELDYQKQKKLIENMKKFKAQQEQIKKQNRAAIAANPEMIEGMTPDQFTSQKQMLKLKEKILDKEKTVLRDKINDRKLSDKTFKQIGEEKKKAMEKLKQEAQSKGSIESSI